MTGNALSPGRLAVLAASALLAGAAVAAVQGGDAPAAKPVARAAAVPAPAPARPARLPLAVLAPGAPPVLPAVGPCPRDRRTPRTTASDVLLKAFAILRRERNDDDALPARALRALEQRGLEPVDPHSARLLRADGTARAWVVPVPDVGVADLFSCRRGAKPREGLAVVAVGGAPAGGGGGLRDLQRGLASPSIDSCVGAGRDMLGVSGIVPDGVEAVFITAPDGSAIRADVRDNGYAFVLPRPRRSAPRYVVWTGADGTPHVQPLGFTLFGPRRGACPVRQPPPSVTPDPWSAGCGPLAPRPAFVPPARPPRIARAPRPSRMRPSPARRVPRALPAPSRALRRAPAPLLVSPACFLPQEFMRHPPPRALPAPAARPRPAPAPPRGP